MGAKPIDVKNRGNIIFNTIIQMHSDASTYDPGEDAKTPKRRRKIPTRTKHQDRENCKTLVFPIDELSTTLEKQFFDNQGGFERFILPVFHELVKARKDYEDSLLELDESGRKIRPLRHYEVPSLYKSIAASDEKFLPSQALLLRKLRVESAVNTLNLKERSIQAPNTTLTPLQNNPSTPIDPDVLDALYGVQTTTYNNSFVSRLQGTKSRSSAGLISVDWEIKTPWMELMIDIRRHFSFAHPEREQAIETLAPITYCSLRAIHLPQVHDLLERSFWPGIDVSDSLEYQPEKATVLALYKKVVVGVTILKSPQEPYIMYLAVKAGWDKSQIARTMLYHLITLNPHKDITLHVSTNNSAMLLYNQFGFKVEEFVAGFYSKYLDPHSRLSNNALKLRLRHRQS